MTDASNTRGRRASDRAQTDRVLVNLMAVIGPVLITLLAYFANAKIDQMSVQLTRVQQNTSTIAAMAVRSDVSERELDRLRAIVLQHDKELERGKEQRRNHERRLDKIEGDGWIADTPR